MTLVVYVNVRENTIIEGNKGRRYSHIADNIRVYEGAVILAIELLATHATFSSMSVALGRKRDIAIGRVQSPDR